VTDREHQKHHDDVTEVWGHALAEADGRLLPTVSVDAADWIARNAAAYAALLTACRRKVRVAL